MVGSVPSNPSAPLSYIAGLRWTTVKMQNYVFSTVINAIRDIVQTMSSIQRGDFDALNGNQLGS